MLNIICWKWRRDPSSPTKYNKSFTYRHVNVLYNMLKRHLHIPFQLICLTDDAEGIYPEVRVEPLINDFADLGGCYRRLKLFDPNINGSFGKRFVSIDLDVVIVDDVTPIFDRDDDFIIWGEDERKTPYCGSMWMMNSGSRNFLWNKWIKNPKAQAERAKSHFKVGTDQSFITYCLYPEEKTWTKEDGIYNFKLDVKIPDNWKKPKKKKDAPKVADILKLAEDLPAWKRKRLISKYKMNKAQAMHIMSSSKNRKRMADYEIIQRNQPDGTLASNARMIFFNGRFDPSSSVLRRKYPWIEENWK